MLLLLAVTVMSTINATNSPDIALVIVRTVVNQQEQSLLHALALHCNDFGFEAKVKEELLFLQDVDGVTAFNILEVQECQTELCCRLKEFAAAAKKEKDAFVQELDKAELDATPVVSPVPVQE